jgi:hypothetical protein
MQHLTFPGWFTLVWSMSAAVPSALLLDGLEEELSIAQKQFSKCNCRIHRDGSGFYSCMF